MTEEEETSTLTSAFTRLEDLLAIGLRWKTLLKQLDVKIVQLKELSKLVQSMVCNVRLCCNLLIFGDRLHQFWLLPFSTFPLIKVVLEEVLSRCLLPGADILDEEWPDENSCIATFLHFVLHLLESPLLIDSETILDEVEKGELCDTLKDDID